MITKQTFNQDSLSIHAIAPKCILLKDNIVIAVKIPLQLAEGFTERILE